MDLKKYFDTRNINFVNPSYLYRSGTPNKLDYQMAQVLGEKAIESLIKEKASYFLTISLMENKFIINKYSTKDEKSIDDLHRFVPNEFYDKVNLKATDLYKKYISKIVKEISTYDYNIDKN